MFKAVPLYTAHPATNFLQHVTPRKLVEASRHIHKISFTNFSEVHATIEELANVVVRLNPTLVFFFATGGIPIVFPLMKRVAAEMNLSSNRVFHMFPGLAWDGEIAGKRPTEYFCSEAVPLVKGQVDGCARQRILVIDTTNTGNAVNLAVGAIAETCRMAGVKNSDVYVLGVVNASGNISQMNDDRRVVLNHGNRTDLSVSVPNGYSPCSPIVSGSFVDLMPALNDSNAMPPLKVGYWVVDKLFTEDQAELLGVASLYSHLGIRSMGNTARMEILFDNKRTSVISGLSSIGSRLLYLLESKTTSACWRRLDEINILGPETQAELAFKVETELERDAFISLLEMDKSPESTIKDLVAMRGPLRAVQIYWLASQDPLPRELIGRVAGAVRDSVLGTSDHDDEVVKEGIAFLRLAYPEDAGNEPQGESIAQLKQWWVAAYQRRVAQRSQ